MTKEELILLLEKILDQFYEDNLIFYDEAVKEGFEEKIEVCKEWAEMIISAKHELKNL
ncbi:MAG TPA: hypothetical protein VGA67_01190 [Candidatus Dojkabacteria bacterium]